MKPEISFGHASDSINFCDGVIDASCYSYQIDSWGDITLSKEETKKLYLTMEQYYKQQGE